MNKIIASIFAALLLAVPCAIAADDYWYYNYPSSGSGRSYESYQRTYDTTRSDIASRNAASTNTMANSGYYGYPGYPYSYNGYYQYNPGNPNFGGALGYPYYGGSNSYTNTYSDNYNRQYSEKTNEVIKVDKYVAYDNQGMYYPTYGSAGSHHPYYYSVVNNDAYGYRYPYAGQSMGDTGYYAQPYYSTTSPQEIIIRLPDYTSANMPNTSAPTIVCPQNRQVSVLQLTKSADGPSQTYGNAIVDRGAIGAAQRPVITQVNLQSAGAARNPCDTSLYTSGSQRDTTYVQIYTRN